MNSLHDMGGMDGFGPIDVEENEPYFHEEWEGRMIGLFAACFVGGHYIPDIFRHGIERFISPKDYLEFSYYEKWLASIQNLLIENGSVTQAELDARYEELKKEAT